nr:global transcription factor group B1 [Tanacetum cinerariifolium]
MADRINTKLAIGGKHGINVMMVPRFNPDSNVAEVEEQIKDNRIEVKFDKTSMKETPLDMLQEENENVLEKAAVKISCEPYVRRHVRSIFMDCAMVSTRPTANGRVSIDANHEFAVTLNPLANED